MESSGFEESDMTAYSHEISWPCENPAVREYLACFNMVFAWVDHLLHMETLQCSTFPYGTWAVIRVVSGQWSYPGSATVQVKYINWYVQEDVCYEEDKVLVLAGMTHFKLDDASHAEPCEEGFSPFKVCGKQLFSNQRYLIPPVHTLWPWSDRR